MFTAVLYERLNRAEYRCEEKEGYSFTACYKVTTRSLSFSCLDVSPDPDQSRDRLPDPVGPLDPKGGSSLQ